MRVNALGTSAVLEAVRDCAAVDRVLVASSSFAYGRTEAADQPVSESTPLRPVTPYGASKAAAEDIALAWQRETGRDVVVTRAFQHTGPGHVGRYALSDWASQLVGRPASISVGNLDVVRDYLDVRDVARAYLEVAARANPGDVVNVGSGEERTMRLMLEGLVDAFGADTRIVVDPARLRAVDQPVFVADNEKLRGLGWRPRYTIGETLSDLAAWYDARDQARPSA
jgi:GDP-4-dehydro-6-deoxy-D-mannose reductase